MRRKVPHTKRLTATACDAIEHVHCDRNGSAMLKFESQCVARYHTPSDCVQLDRRRQSATVASLGVR